MSAGLGALAAGGGARLVFLWPSLTFALVAFAYLKGGPRLLGKRPDGTRAWSSRILMWPYLATAALVWNGIRLVRREAAYHRVHETLLVGRRLLARELPDEVTHVVDLTTEMLDPPEVRARGYLARPILDGTPPRDLAALVEEVSALEGVRYVHCAEGHGRAGLLGAALLVFEGHASDPGEAVALMQAARPKVRLMPVQRRALVRFVKELNVDEVSARRS